MGVYYLALPLGTALGYILGGTIADLLGWQAVFFVVGLPGLAGRARGAGHPRAREGRVGGDRGGEICRSARPERIPRPVPHPDIPLQHRGHGRRDLRDRRVCGLGVDLLSAGAQPLRQGRGDEDRPAPGRRRLARDRPGDVPARPPSQGHPAGLPPARRVRRDGRRRRSGSSASSTTIPRCRWASCSGRRCSCRWCSARATR